MKIFLIIIGILIAIIVLIILGIILFFYAVGKGIQYGRYQDDGPSGPAPYEINGEQPTHINIRDIFKTKEVK